MVVGPLSAFPTLAPPRPMALLRRLAATFLAERERWPLWLPVGLALGIGAYFDLPSEPSLAAALGVAAFCAGAWTAAALTRSALLRAGLAFLAAVALGAATAKLHTEMAAAPVLEHRMGPLGIEGRIASVEMREKGARVVLDHASAERLGPGEMPRRMRLTLRTATDALAPGRWVRVNAVLMPPPGPAMPGSYDFGRAAYYDGIGAVGFVYGKAAAMAPKAPIGIVDSLATGIESLRAHMTARIHAVLPGSNGAISAALITGDRGGIDPADNQAYRDAGIAHVLSISGLHLALAGGLFFWLVRALLALIPAIALNHPVKKWAALAALGGATFYILISGCDAPAVRSYIMLAIMFLAILADRPAITMRNVALAAAIILVFRPQSLIEPGFEMSFAAVIGLIALAEWQQGRAADAPPTLLIRARRYLVGIALATLVASLATAPFAIYHFDRSARYGLLANLATVPITGFVIMPAATVSMVVMPLGLERWPLIVMGKGVAVMTAVAHAVADLPGASALTPSLPQAALLALAAGGLWIALWRRRWRWLGLLAVAAGMLVAMAARGPDLLVARDGVTVALRGTNGLLHFLRRPRDKYAAQEWLKRDGDERDIAAALATSADGVRCDGLGCIARGRDGALVAAPKRIDALSEDCARATIVVSAVPAARGCHGPMLVIDRFDVAREGGYAIWLGGTPRVETVEGERGRRPWSAPPPRRRSQYRRIRPTSLP